ncbi:hypothetical protein E3N88_39981 [Mikania micrantha]|uniref:Aminotransferase-like plant mobile domain-containing protein n=1 Tax=Mikania micrantha TaxID=192012 RepID=A0A5N6LLD8_9ASTR|nr:hypothetical protein E3N88_39981 [Mikania micrantha]
MSYDLHPGPIVDDVLFLKDSHRARDIKSLVFRRAYQKFFSLFNNNPITENVKRYVNIAGFGGLLVAIGTLNMAYLRHLLKDGFLKHTRFICQSVKRRNLCKATSSNANNIGGPMYILQLWAWCRITTIAPRILHPFDNTRPYGAMVMRQFGMVQHIPSPFPLSINDHMKLHTLTRSGKPERNWMNTHLEYVTVWNQRWQNVIQGVRCATPTVEPNYMQWFWSRTLLYITNPKSQEVMQPGFQDHGSRSQFLMDGISQTYQQVGGFMQTDSTSNFHNFELLQSTANQVMGMVQFEDVLGNADDFLR